MSDSVDDRIRHATRYIDELKWAVLVVRNSGSDPKAPLFRGWSTLRYTAEEIASILRRSPQCGIGLHLGASDLVDLEGDTPDGESMLTEMCNGLKFPCWRSRRSTHRLFRRHPSISKTTIEPFKIEFRTGSHQSILPPSVIGPEQTRYEWIVSPFEVEPPPMPDHILAFYDSHRSGSAKKMEADTSSGASAASATKKQWQYRDNRDYVLRKLDLQRIVAEAGLNFAHHTPDVNGNIPCFVPAVLREGNEDEHASGVFNVHNGVLRDFATDRNTLFFNLMAALTGERWQVIFDRYEKQCGATQGRPHSRRVCPPEESSSQPHRIPLAEARASLEAYYEDQLSRPPRPKTLHLIEGAPGVGKTYTLCKMLAEKNVKATILTLENKLAKTHTEIITSGGGKPDRMPVLRESPCPMPDEYEATSRRGFKASQSFPCRKCPIGPTHCPYLLGFSSLDKADQLCCAAIYHTHDDFYASHGNHERPILVFDENCLDLLLEPVAFPVSQWREWVDMLMRREDRTTGAQHAVFAALIEWLEHIEREFVASVDVDGKPVKFEPHTVPTSLKIADLGQSEAISEWLDKHAYQKENRHVSNLYAAAVYLLTEPESYVLLERIVKVEETIVLVRFRKKNPLPEDKEVFVLDATANKELLRAVAPGWDVRVWPCPPIEQAGRVVQIMDYDVSRRRLRKEIENHADHNPSWLVQILDRILAEHGPASIITFKDVVSHPKPDYDLLSKLSNVDQIDKRYNFPCRGHTFDDQTLIVLGTPYKDEAAIWELAMAIWGPKGLPTSKYAHVAQENGCFISQNMGYAESHLQPLRDFVVSADLVQAIGRVRPLQNPATVFVISNAPISGWHVDQFMASELFDIRIAMRKDAAGSYSEYRRAANELLHGGKAFTNVQVCAVISMPERTGRNYWLRYKEEYSDRIEVTAKGQVRLKEEPMTFSPYGGDDH